MYFVIYCLYIMVYLSGFGAVEAMNTVLNMRIGQLTGTRY